MILILFHELIRSQNPKLKSSQDQNQKFQNVSILLYAEIINKPNTELEFLPPSIILQEK